VKASLLAGDWAYGATPENCPLECARGISTKLLHSAFIGSTPTANSKQPAGLPQPSDGCSSTPGPWLSSGRHRQPTASGTPAVTRRLLGHPSQPNKNKKARGQQCCTRAFCAGPQYRQSPEGALALMRPGLAAHLGPGRGRRARRLPRIQLGLSDRPCTSPKGSSGNW
jgi:hypothetical protein